jgi:hypothetical protein
MQVLKTYLDMDIETRDYLFMLHYGLKGNCTMWALAKHLCFFTQGLKK